MQHALERSKCLSIKLINAESRQLLTIRTEPTTLRKHNSSKEEAHDPPPNFPPAEVSPRERDTG